MKMKFVSDWKIIEESLVQELIYQWYEDIELAGRCISRKIWKITTYKIEVMTYPIKSSAVTCIAGSIVILESNAIIYATTQKKEIALITVMNV